MRPHGPSTFACPTEHACVEESMGVAGRDDGAETRPPHTSAWAVNDVNGRLQPPEAPHGPNGHVVVGAAVAVVPTCIHRPREAL